MLNEEVKKYRELSGDNNPHTPISRIGGYLDGYEKAMEQKTGHWYVNEWGNITCSECGCAALYDKVYPNKSMFGEAIRVKSTFCPTCGAKMAESEDKDANSR